jgi:hypothetical protein
VFGALTDKLGDLGSDRKVSHVEVRVTTVGGDTSGLRTLLAAPPMLAKVPFTVSIAGSSSFEGIAGDVSAAGLEGPEKDLRKITKGLFDLWDQALDLTAEVALLHSAEEPFGVESEAWKVISSTITDLKPGTILVRVTGA